MARLQPLFAILFLAASVCILIAVLILTARWNIAKPVSVLFIAIGVVLGAPYLLDATRR